MPDRQASLTQVVQAARRQLEELVGQPVEAVSGMQRDGDDWRVTAQVVELRRVPSSTDVLGDYEVTLTGDGEVSGFRRTGRYYRSQAEGAGA